jgi:hypothetical protein
VLQHQGRIFLSYPLHLYLFVKLNFQYTVKPVYSGQLGEVDKITTIDR